MSATTFEPETPVLRQEFAAFFVRYMKYMFINLPDVDGIKPFPDKAKFPDWAVNDIEALQKTGLVKGDNLGNFNPGNKMTRAEIATVVMRFVELIEKDTSDRMHAAFEAFLDKYTCVLHKDVIHMTVYGGGQFEPALRSIPLDVMHLDPEVYEMCFDEDELEAAKSDCAGQGNGYGGGGKITFWVRNKNTGEETEHVVREIFARKNLYSGINSLMVCSDDSVIDNEAELKLKAFDCPDESHEEVEWTGLHGIHMFFPDAASFTEDAVKALILKTAELDNSYDVILTDFNSNIRKCDRFQANIVKWDGKVVDLSVSLFFLPSIDSSAPATGAIGGHPVPKDTMIEDIESLYEELQCIPHSDLNLMFGTSGTLTTETLGALFTEIFGYPAEVSQDEIDNIKEPYGSYYSGLGDGQTAGADAVEVTFTNPAFGTTYTAYFDIALYKCVSGTYCGAIVDRGYLSVCPDDWPDDARAARDAIDSAHNSGAPSFWVASDVFTIPGTEYTEAAIEEWFRGVTGLGDDWTFFIKDFDASKAYEGNAVKIGFRNDNINDEGRSFVISCGPTLKIANP